MKTTKENVNLHKEDSQKVYGKHIQHLRIQKEEVFFLVSKNTGTLLQSKDYQKKQIHKYQKNFWSVLNDRNKISRNILLNHHVKIVEYDGKKLLEIQIPAADRHDKPVYVGTDPMKGTYRRDYEGDFLCTEASVRAMFADQRDKSIDSEVWKTWNRCS